MEIKDTLKKPYTDKAKADFIVENNHNKGYQIKETETALEAWGYTEEEQQENAKSAKIAELKAKRDAELNATDFYLMSDYPISDEDLRLIQSYRQALRDLPQQEDFPYVEFPKNPLES